MEHILYLLEQNALNIIFGLIGLTGTSFGVISWYSTRKKNQAYDYLFKLADLNIDKDITEEQLARKRQDIANATKCIQNLQEKIRKEIPIEAKRAVLKDRLNAEMEQLNQSYKATLRTKSDLDRIGEEISISPELLSSVESAISPSYIMKERQSQIKTYLSIVTTAAAIASSILPRPIDNFVTFPLLTVGLFMLVILFRQSVRFSARTSRKTKALLIRSRYFLPLFASFIFLLIALFIGMIILSNISLGFTDYLEGPIAFASIFFIGFIAFLIFGLREYRLYRLEIFVPERVEDKNRELELPGDDST